MKKITVAVLALALLIITATGCQQTDVVGKFAVTTWSEVLDKGGLPIENDAALKAWSLTAPGGERFLWTSDSAAGKQDLVQEFDATPFLAAGLNPEALPETYSYDESTNKIQITADLGDKAYEYSADETPLLAFEQLVKNYRDRIGYHEALDHYGVGFGDGNMFEWAKDMASNDKDIVFVLNPEPFVAAGVDPNTVEGWVFAKVPMKDDSGKAIEVDKLLKPYELTQ